jgi:GR25 family glycosyltransferase involved in LPS biosynthesis
MNTTIPSFILHSIHEPERKNQVDEIKKHLPQVEIIEPVFPKYQRVPFLQSLVQKSKERTGKKLLITEIGVLMSHRKIWQKIVTLSRLNINPANTHYLIFESDSKIIDLETLYEHIGMVQNKYELFFWGAWHNNVSIKKSSIQAAFQNYIIGTPLIKSVYCAYGYSINAKAAQKMLDATNKINYPLDLFKHYYNINSFSIGAIKPEVISTWQTTESTIRAVNMWSRIKHFIIINIFYIRNQIKAYFS